MIRSAKLTIAAATLALGTLALAACATPAQDIRVGTVTSSAAITPVQSLSGFDATESALRNAISTRGLTLFTVVDHGQGARKVGLDIGRSKLFLFGNPEAGTPLMEADPTVGLRLPLKVLIYTDVQGRTLITRSDIREVVGAYDIEGQDARVDKIDGTLDAVVAEAAGR